MTLMRMSVGRMNCKKCMTLSLTICVVFILFLYMTFFYHGSADTILAANRRRNSYLEEVLARGGDDEVSRSARAWQQFIEDNKFVAIGDIYNDCDDKDRVWLGKSVILPDPLRGGVTSKTFVNVTFEKELAEGDFFLQVFYEGKELYENEWDLCTMEDEDDEERFINCPYEAKAHNWAIERKIPNYLPKGRYKAKAWITDTEEKPLLCGEAEFVL